MTWDEHDEVEDGDTEFNPDWVSAPGDTIEDILEAKKISHDEFAAKCELTTDQADLLIRGDLEITTELAQKLSSVLGAPADFWIRREAHYREGLSKGLKRCTCQHYAGDISTCAMHSDTVK